MTDVTKATILFLLITITPFPSLSAPPPGSANPEISAWYRSLKSVRTGISCCSEADCRRTAIEQREDGTLWAWIGKDQFGSGAPDQWLPIPAIEAISRENRPPQVIGAQVCYYSGEIHCADLEGGS